MRWDQSLERMASGKRINKASDDAAGLAIAARMSSQMATQGQGLRNLQDGLSLARVAEGALGESSNLIGRMRELSIQGQNGILSPSDRATIQQEYDALSEELTRISASTQFNGSNLLDGSLTGAGAVSIENGQGPETSGTEIDLPDASAGALGVQGQSVAQPATIDKLDQALDQLTRTRAALGSIENRLTSQISQVGSAQESTAAARSRIEDSDLALEISELIQARMLDKGQISVEMQSRLISRRSILELLRGRASPDDS